MGNRDQLIDYLNGFQVITLKEAQRLGVNAMMLSRGAKEGWLYRLGEGVYTGNPNLLFDPVKKYLPLAVKYPDAVIGFVSALVFHDLTDEEEREIWIAVPHEKKVKASTGTRVFRLSGAAYSLGIQTHKVGKRAIQIYDAEKSIVDAFKYLTEEIAIKALRTYLKRRKIDVPKLLSYGKKLKCPLDEQVKMIMTV